MPHILHHKGRLPERVAECTTWQLQRTFGRPEQAPSAVPLPPDSARLPRGSVPAAAPAPHAPTTGRPRRAPSAPPLPPEPPPTAGGSAALSPGSTPAAALGQHSHTHERLRRAPFAVLP